MRLNRSWRRLLMCAWLCALPWLAQAQAPVLELDGLQRLTGEQAAIESIAKGFDAQQGESTYAVVLANVSAAVLHGPLYVVIEDLSASSKRLRSRPDIVRVKNATGLTSSGLPYFLMSEGDLAPAAAGVGVLVIFANPQNAPLSFAAVGYMTPDLTPPALQVAITQPATLITVGSTPLSVQGTINDAQASLTVNGVPVSHAGGRFEANVALSEGHNAIVARAVNARGEEATGTIAVSLDRTPPFVTIDSPSEGAVVSSALVSVSGLVNDIVRGTVSEGQANVTVNGRPASVANRSYFAADIPLQEGVNTIRVEAADQVGNLGAAQVQVSYQPPTDQFIELLSGQGQQGRIRQVLSESLRVKLQRADGTAVSEQAVVFRVSQGDGAVGVGASDEGPAVLVRSDAQGIASTRYRLGTRAGSGNQRVSARAVGFEGEVEFFASAVPNAGDKVSVNSGNNQRGAANQALPLPFVVVVSDDGANVIAGAEVEFAVETGGGAFSNAQRRISALTDSDGRASATLRLGSELGLDVHRVSATLVGSELSAGFTASALQSGAAGATSISGVVLDNQDRPLPNVTLRVEGTTRQALSDEQGRFKITEAPVGPVHLIADGSTTTLAGEWPSLPYNLVTISGADNPLPAPVYMVKLDTARAVTVGAEDKEITLPELPGFKLTVKAGSVTFPNGDRVGQLSVTPVNAAKIPMTPPNGMQPQLIVTIQPTGARFDPPAALELPNVDGHAPGAQVEMYSFDHDLEEFVAIGLGAVSADGTRIVSNTGVGVIKAGWHCGSQPGGSGCVAACNVCSQSQSDCTCEERPATLLATLNDDPSFDDIEGDCQRPQCPGPEHIAEPADLPRNHCNTCQVNADGSGSIVPARISDVRALAEGSEDEVWKVSVNGSPASVHFTASLRNRGCRELTYAWDFGDGTSSNEESPDHAYTAPGRYLVVLRVTCGQCLSEFRVDSVEVLIVGIQHQTVAETPNNRSRTDLGVAERVELRVLPGEAVEGVLVELEEESPGTLEAPDLGRWEYTAPAEAGVARLTISKTGRFHRVVVFNIFAPNQVTQLLVAPVHVPEGEVGARMQMDPRVHSIDDQGVERLVSFYGIEVTNFAAAPEEVSGYFVGLPLPATVPLPCWCGVLESNFVVGNFLPGGSVDRAELSNPPFPQTPVFPLPVEQDGAFVYHKPWRYRVKDDPSPFRTDYDIGLTHQEITISGPGDFRALGTVTISEAGACMSRSPDGTQWPC